MCGDSLYERATAIPWAEAWINDDGSTLLFVSGDAYDCVGEIAMFVQT